MYYTLPLKKRMMISLFNIYKTLNDTTYILENILENILVTFEGKLQHVLSFPLSYHIIIVSLFVQ